jgi:putative FmdB family regulatory protein
MPFYEYECQSCKFYTEIMQKISDPPLKKCPSCGKSTMKKLISAPAFRLKGAGWYETDFKSDKEDKRNLAVDKEPEAKESKPADATPADGAKPEGKPATEAKPPQESPKPASEVKRKGKSKSIAVSRKASARTRPRTRTRARKKARR